VNSTFAVFTELEIPDSLNNARDMNENPGKRLRREAGIPDNSF